MSHKELSKLSQEFWRTKLNVEESIVLTRKSVQLLLKERVTEHTPAETSNYNTLRTVGEPLSEKSSSLVSALLQYLTSLFDISNHFW